MGEFEDARLETSTGPAEAFAFRGLRGFGSGFGPPYFFTFTFAAEGSEGSGDKTLGFATVVSVFGEVFTACVSAHYMLQRVLDLLHLGRFFGSPGPLAHNPIEDLREQN